MIGTNNIRNSKEHVLAGVTKVVSEVHEKLPNSKLLLLGIFPRGADPAGVLEEALAKTSRHRLVTADDIANTIVFLCSLAGANISGQAIAVDGDAQSLV